MKSNEIIYQPYAVQAKFLGLDGAVGEPLDDDPGDTEDEIPSHDPIINGPRTGRNEPCPCGSGVKFKRCCYGKEST